MQYLKQSTAVDVVLGPFVDDSDGKTTEEGLTLSQADLQLTKNGGTAAQKNDATSATHLYGGNYKVPLNTTDTGTLGCLTLMCKESGALPVVAHFMVVTANWWDTMCSTDKLDVNVEEWNATSVPAEHTAGYPIVTVKDGTGTGEINTTSGRVDADITHVATAAVNTASAQLGVNVVNAAGTAWGSGAITAASIATGAIDADALAADTLTAAKVAADVGTEIASAVWATALPGSFTSGQAGKLVGDNVNAPIATVDTVVDAIKVKTDYLPSVTAGAAGGVFIAGSNAATSVTTALTANITGNLSGSVGSVATGGITSGSFAAGAVNAAAIATDAIDADAIAAGAIDAGAFAAGAITATVIADNAIDLATFAADCKTGSALKANVETVTAGAITAAAIATGAIDADALAADAVDEILDEQIGDSTVTMRQALKLLVATLGGKLSGAATTTITIRNYADTTDVVSATVDANGNRTATTLTL